jgi:hypothetical protein
MTRNAIIHRGKFDPRVKLPTISNSRIAGPDVDEVESRTLSNASFPRQREPGAIPAFARFHGDDEKGLALPGRLLQSGCRLRGIATSKHRRPRESGDPGATGTSLALGPRFRGDDDLKMGARLVSECPDSEVRWIPQEAQRGRGKGDEGMNGK